MKIHFKDIIDDIIVVVILQSYKNLVEYIFNWKGLTDLDMIIISLFYLVRGPSECAAVVGVHLVWRTAWLSSDEHDITGKTT